MPMVLDGMIDHLDDLVKSAVLEVFDTMLNIKMVQNEPDVEKLATGGPHVASSVGFIGRLTGVVYLYTTEAFAKRITATLLGVSEAEVDAKEMLNDCMGEMANMVVGHMKSRLSDRGMPCVLTIPSVVRGSAFSVEAVSSTENRIYSFQSTPDECLVVEFLMKPTDLKQ